MLQTIHIKDFILIKNLDLDLNEGFCVITGETGAGKSILLEAILFCFGKKMSISPIRTPCDMCSVTLVFNENYHVNDYLKQNDIEPGRQLFIKCTQNAQGRRKFFVNDQLVTVKTISYLFDSLIELHGQNNHTLLLDTASHIKILDDFGSNSELKVQVRESYQRIKNLEQTIDEFNLQKARIEYDIDYLQHICAELQEANIQPGEEQKLLELKRKAQSYSKDKALIEQVINEIDESNIEKLLLKIQRSLIPSGELLLNQVVNDLDIVYEKIDRVKSGLYEFMNDLHQPESSFEEIDDRLYLIKTLARKHSRPADELPSFLDKSLLQLESLQKKKQNSSESEAKLKPEKEQYFLYAGYLSKARADSALKLAKKVMEELAFLDMEKAHFKIDIKQQENHISVNGIDKVRFVAATNPGMKPDAIDKIASGGELSRMMLALRVSLFNCAPKYTVIFDEIDIGISGSVADSIGVRLSRLGKAAQTIVITHHPQVAGKADQHILVVKTHHHNHTESKAQIITDGARAYELARMISGKEITPAALRAAEELLG